MNKDMDIPFKKTPGSITYDQLGKFLTNTLDKVHEKEMDKIRINKQKQKNKKK